MKRVQRVLNTIKISSYNENISKSDFSILEIL